ncbi:MAG: glycosyltransferase, partial [Maribacter sp.]
MADIKVIIPAYNEADSIAQVIQEIPESVSEIIVVNNNSSDETAKNAEIAGATVLSEKNMGYGYACLCGIHYVGQQSKTPDIIV